jgi:hypothetical protein
VCDKAHPGGPRVGFFGSYMAKKEGRSCGGLRESGGEDVPRPYHHLVPPGPVALPVATIEMAQPFLFGEQR